MSYKVTMATGSYHADMSPDELHAAISQLLETELSVIVTNEYNGVDVVLQADNSPSEIHAKITEVTGGDAPFSALADRVTLAVSLLVVVIIVGAAWI